MLNVSCRTYGKRATNGIFHNKFKILTVVKCPSAFSLNHIRYGNNDNIMTNVHASPTQTQPLVPVPRPRSEIMTRQYISDLEFIKLANRLWREILNDVLDNSLRELFVGQLKPNYQHSLKSSQSGVWLYRDFPHENLRSTFENFKTDTKQQQTLYNIHKRFADSVLSKKGGNVSGLIVSGGTGIGKTHLAVSVANLVARGGKKVLFVDEDIVSRQCQLPGKRLGLFEIADSYDLIVYDCVGDKYGVGSIIYKDYIKYVIEHNKSILVTSNVMNMELPAGSYNYSGNDSPSPDQQNSFVVVRDLGGDSQRTSINPYIFWRKRNQAIWPAIFGNFGKNVVIVDESAKTTDEKTRHGQLEKIRAIYNKKNPYAKVFVTEKPGYCEKINDFYMVGIDNPHRDYDTVITSVTDEIEIEQFIRLIPIAHNNNLRVIVLTHNFEYFKSGILHDIETDLCYQSHIPRLKDRLKVMLGKK